MGVSFIVENGVVKAVQGEVKTCADPKAEIRVLFTSPTSTRLN
jgi:hypothetical protein